MGFWHLSQPQSVASDRSSPARFLRQPKAQTLQGRGYGVLGNQGSGQGAQADLFKRARMLSADCARRL